MAIPMLSKMAKVFAGKPPLNSIDADRCILMVACLARRI